MAIATGGSRRQVTKAMAAAGLSDFFHAVVTCDASFFVSFRVPIAQVAGFSHCARPLPQDITEGKPHPETFLRAAELIGVVPAHCVGYEDAVLGMEAIRRAGFLAAVDVTALEGYPKLE